MDVSHAARLSGLRPGPWRLPCALQGPFPFPQVHPVQRDQLLFGMGIGKMGKYVARHENRGIRFLRRPTERRKKRNAPFMFPRPSHRAQCPLSFRPSAALSCHFDQATPPVISTKRSAWRNLSSQSCHRWCSYRHHLLRFTPFFVIGGARLSTTCDALPLLQKRQMHKANSKVDKACQHLCLNGKDAGREVEQ